MKRKWTLAATVIAAATMTTSAWAHDTGTWVLKAGPGMVSPSSDGLYLQQSELADGSIVQNAYAEADDATSLVLNATYFINEHWAVDFLGAWPFEHDASLVGMLDGSPVSIKFGTVKQMPPTVSLQYHFAPDAVIQPYIGLGGNFTTFFSESINDAALQAYILDFSVADSYGFSFQLGADWRIGDKWVANLDARYIQIESKVTLLANLGDVGDPDPFSFEVPGHLEINPYVASFTIGYCFE